MAKNTTKATQTNKNQTETPTISNQEPDQSAVDTNPLPKIETVIATTPTEPTVEQANEIVAATLNTVLDAFPEEFPEWPEPEAVFNPPVPGAEFARPISYEESAARLAQDLAVHAFPQLCAHAGFDGGPFDKLHPLTQSNYIKAARAVLDGERDREPATDFERIVKDMLLSGYKASI